MKTRNDILAEYVRSRYPEDEDCGIVFSDNDAYWFPDRPGQLTLVQKGGADV